MAYESNEESSLRDKVIHISRHAKVVKGGRRFSFAALVVVGDGSGKVGIAKGKAKEVPDAIKKGFERAKREMRDVKLSGHTIPHEVMGHFGSGRVYMRPAAPGTGVIAGGATRAILEAVGVRDVFAKSHGTSNPHNVAKATIEGLLRLRSRGDFESLRTAAPAPPAPPRPAAAAVEGMPEDQPQG